MKRSSGPRRTANVSQSVQPRLNIYALPSLVKTSKRGFHWYSILAILISSITASATFVVAQENYSESRTAKGAGSNRSFVYTDNNLYGPNRSSVFALSGQRLAFRRKALTGGLGNSGGDYYGLDQIVMLQDSGDDCGFVVDARSDDISAFRTRPHGLGVFPPWHRYTDPKGSGRVKGIGLSVSGKYLFAAYADTNNIGVWKIHNDCTLKLLHTYNAAGSIAGMKAAPNGQTLVVGYGTLDGSGLVDSFSIGDNGKLTERGPYSATGEATGVDITRDSHYAIFGDSTKLTTQVEIYPINRNGSLGDETVFGGDGSLGSGLNSSNVWLSPDENFLFVSNNWSAQLTSLAFQEKPLSLSYIGITTLRKAPPQYTNGIITVLPSSNGGFVCVAESSYPYGQIGMLKINTDGSTTEVSRSPFVVTQGEGGGYGLQSLAVFPPRPF